MAATKQAKIATPEDFLKLIESQITEYSEALAFVLESMDGPNKVQYSRVFQRKKAEYEGAIDALITIHEAVNGKTYGE